MGRRKIEIKAIKDDRNRSVTFLKRKGGLFKKAHELSVLCSVDVAVIIFGHNKKLYEYSSGDINETIGRHQYYGGAHEHKGPSDFAGKGDMDGDDDEEVDDAAIEEQMAAEQHMPPHIQNQPGYSHMRHAPSASPPVGNGAMPYHPRGHTPQPPQMGSRPSSRNANPNQIRRPNSTLGHQVTHGPPLPNGYAYMQGPQGPYGPPQQHPPHHGMPMQHPGQQPQPHPQFQYPPQPPPHPQQQPPQQHLQQPYMQDGRRQGSMPPQFPQNERPPMQHQPPPPQHHQQQQPQPPQQQQHQPQTHLTPQPPQPHIKQSPSPPRQEPEIRQDHLQVQAPQQPKPLSVKSRSIFTPIDDSRSMLAGGWDFGSRRETQPEIKQEVKTEKDIRSQPVDVGSVQRHPPPEPPQRTFTQPQRTQSTASLGSGRPRLKVQIPSEHSDDEEGDGSGTSPKQSAPSNGTPAKTESHGSGVVLPPPSPSASALLSAGAQGPPNPFARPLPPGANGPGGSNVQAYNSNQNIETPISALPSRFMSEQFLPSPSAFYPEWGFGGQRSAGDGNMLPSPLNFQTPVQGNGPEFGAEDERKRKNEDDGEYGEGKRVKA